MPAPAGRAWPGLARRLPRHHRTPRSIRDRTVRLEGGGRDGDYIAAANWAAAAGTLRLIFLRVDGRAIAFHLALEDNGAYLPLKGGYDSALQALSPGKLIIHATLERAFAVGLRYYDFLGGFDDYKRRWASGFYDRLLLQAFAPTVTGRARAGAFRYGHPLARRILAPLRGGSAV